MTNYVVASSKTWFKEHLKSSEYKKLSIHEISAKKDLNLMNLDVINPRYIFFPHWHWKIEPEIYLRYECVVFHAAPLPYGRGGSPIQNLIINGFKESPVCAIKITDQMDAGPIYCKIEVSLSGSIDEIFKKISVATEKLIISICHENPVPIKQVGDPIIFKRLSIADNELLSSYSISDLYDRVRMVDGKDYPNAYINFGNYKIEFTNAKILENNLFANVKLSNFFNSKIIIRKAEPLDSNDIFAWRNDPHTRAMFFSKKNIEEEEHTKWYDQNLLNPLVTIYIGELIDVKVGVCRFDYEPARNSAEVSINLNPLMRGKNLSFDFLKKAINQFQQTFDYSLVAKIKKSNKSSLKLFNKCGFINTNSDNDYYFFVLNKNQSN